MKKILLLLVLSFASILSHAQQPWTGILATSHGSDWTAAANTIPSATWTQLGSTVAPCGASGSPVTPSACGIVFTGCSSQFLSLGTGDFYLTTGFAIPSNCVLRGQGANATKLHFAAANGCNGWNAAVCLAGSNTFANGATCGGCNEAGWTGGYSQGSTSITLTSVTGITVNLTPIVLDQCETGLSGTTGTDTCTGAAADNSNFYVCDTATTCITQTAVTGIYRTNRAQAEIVVATAISGTGPFTVTLSHAIRNPNWASGQGPRAWWGTSTVTNAGVEDLLIDESTVGQRAVNMSTANHVWARGIATTTANFDHVQNFLTTNDIVRDSYLYLSFSTSQQSYGVGASLSSNLLVENNIMQAVTDPVSFDASCAGCVVGYNFAVNQNYSPSIPYLFPQEAFHSAGTSYTLLEGNVGSQALWDDIHGTHDMDTAFRNFFNGYEPNNGTATTKNTSPFGISAFSRYMNLIGNVVGTAGYHTTYQCVPASSSTVNCGAGQFKDIYDLGWCSNTLGQSQGGCVNDTLTAPTLMRWGNYDTVNNSVQFNSSEVPSGDSFYPNSVPASHTLPSSFYNGVAAHTAGCGTGIGYWKNPTSGTCPPYPPIGPDVTGGTMLRCTSGTYNNSRVLSNAQCAGGTSTADMAGFANPNPAMSCYLNTMNGTPDGTGSILSFNRASCYANDPVPPPANTWFVRPDGGTRYLPAGPIGQCDGLSDLPAAGAVSNHCAFQDFRSLYDDHNFGALSWIISGGDTVVVRGCNALTGASGQQNPANPACRVGWDYMNGTPNPTWCYAVGPYGCFMPPVPSGTASQHTRILGSCAYDSTPGPCNSGNSTNFANLTELFGGFGVSFVMNVQNSSYVDIQGFQIDTHNKVDTGTAFTPGGTYSLGQIVFDGTNTQSTTTAGVAGSAPTWNTTIGGTTTTGAVTFTNEGPNCIRSGSPAYPVRCINNPPMDDYGDNGIATNAASTNIAFQDVWIHGFSASGLQGPIGAGITFTRANISYNAFAGYNFDLGLIGPNGTGYPNSPDSTIAFSYATIDWNGCNQEYPITHTIPCLIAYTISNGGFGDAVSGQNSALHSASCDHCEIANNFKDGWFGPHTAIDNVTITNSTAVDNAGQTWKANLGATGNWKMQNTLTNANCRRLAQPFTGAPSTYNAGISNTDMCRADGAAISVVFPGNGGNFELDDDTFVMASANVAIDSACWSIVTGVNVGVTGGSNGGSGYTVGDLLYVGGTGTVVQVSSVGTGGVITGVTMVTQGQQTTSGVPLNEPYVYGGTGSGAILTYSAITPANCNTGTRIMRNTNFIGYTNPNNATWNSQQITFICYSACQGTPGTSTDAMWTTRSNNNFFGLQAKPGYGVASYPGETTADPSMTNEPSQTWTSETQLDPFNANGGASNSFHPSTGSSALLTKGIPVTGITTDYYGSTRSATTPTIGGVETTGGPPAQASPSTCTPGTGTYSTTQTPACTNPNSGTTVQCYTTNGTTPATNGLGTACTAGTLLVNGGTVSITTTGTVLKIIAGTSTLGDSTVNSYTYTLQVATPTCTPGPGTYPSPQVVTCTSTTPSSTTRCTINGSTPTGTSPICTSISIPTTATLKALSQETGFLDSTIPSYLYTITTSGGGQVWSGTIVTSGTVKVP